jgi:hypothetical protein
LGCLDNTDFHRGHIGSWFLFNRALTSNEVRYVDQALSILASEIPIVIQGDSRTETQYDQTLVGTEWPSAMWWSLGALTNYVTCHNHAYSGKTALNMSNNVPTTLWHRQADLNWQRPHYMDASGFNDIYLNNDNATNVFFCKSNLAWYAKTNGYITHTFTVLPMGTNAASWTLAKATQISRLNQLLLDATNNPTRPWEFIWDVAPIITDAGSTLQLYDGIHMTNAYKTLWGQAIGTNWQLWLRP